MVRIMLPLLSRHVPLWRPLIRGLFAQTHPIDLKAPVKSRDFSLVFKVFKRQVGALHSTAALPIYKCPVAYTSKSIIYHQSPSANMASATFLKPAMLLPATKLGKTSLSPPDGVTYSLAVSSPFLKQDSMMLLSFASTSSLVQDRR